MKGHLGNNSEISKLIFLIEFYGFFWIETPNIKCYIDNLLCYAAVLAGQAHDHLGGLQERP